MRRGGDQIVVISWRDIPAQVNGSSGTDKHQVVLPRRFQRAIDEAAMVAGKKSASDYVAEWRRRARPLPETEGGVDVEAAAEAEADRLKAEFPAERLSAYVATGGWDPDRPADERT
jgi:Virulence factor